MKHVIDASVAFQWEVPEPHSAKARSLRDAFRNQICQLLTTDLFPTEVGNALLVAERRGRILPGQGSLFLTAILQTTPAIHATLPDLLPRAYAIAAATVCTVYDCLYVALAEREGCDFITADDKLVKNLQAQFPFVLSLASVP